jgi:hypothetical protein
MGPRETIEKDKIRAVEAAKSALRRNSYAGFDEQAPHIQLLLESLPTLRPDTPALCWVRRQSRWYEMPKSRSAARTRPRRGLPGLGDRVLAWVRSQDWMINVIEAAELPAITYYGGLRNRGYEDDSLAITIGQDGARRVRMLGGGPV